MKRFLLLLIILLLLSGCINQEQFLLQISPKKPQKPTYREVISVYGLEKEEIMSGENPYLNLRFRNNGKESVKVYLSLFNTAGLELADKGVSTDFKEVQGPYGKEYEFTIYPGNFEEFSFKFNRIKTNFTHSYVLNGYLRYEINGSRKFYVPVSVRGIPPREKPEPVEKEIFGPLIPTLEIKPTVIKGERYYFIKGEPKPILIRFDYYGEFPLTIRKEDLKLILYKGLEIEEPCDFENCIFINDKTKVCKAKENLKLPYEKELTCVIKPTEEALDKETIEIQYKYQVVRFFSKEIIVKPLEITKKIEFWLNGSISTGETFIPLDIEKCSYDDKCSIYPGQEIDLPIEVDTRKISGKAYVNLFLAYSYSANYKDEIVRVNKGFADEFFGGSTLTAARYFNHPRAEMGAGPVDIKMQVLPLTLTDGKATIYINLENKDPTKHVWVKRINLRIINGKFEKCVLGYSGSEFCFNEEVCDKNITEDQVRFNKVLSNLVNCTVKVGRDGIFKSYPIFVRVDYDYIETHQWLILPP